MGLVLSLLLDVEMSERIAAIVRLRQGERKSSDEELKVSLAPDGKSVSLGAAPPTSHSPTFFVFDSVFGAGEEDKTVYRRSVRKIVEGTLLGYNGTLVSLEVEGENAGERDTVLQDAVVRSAEQIFTCLRKSRSSRSAANLVVNCSFVAVANERVYDLLEDYSKTREKSEVSEFAELSFSDDRLQSSVHEAVSTSQVVSLLQHGQRRELKLVEWVGRGGDARYHHTLLSLTVEYSHFGSMNAPVSGTLSFVRLSSALPLAQHLSYTSGGGNLDRKVVSLLTLSEIVKSLKPGDGGNHTLRPIDEKIYSKSVLTRLLRDAVGGNCKTVFVCELCRPLPVSSRAEVIAALDLASRAGKICNRPNKRDLAEKALMSAYMKQLREQYQMTNNSRGEDTNEEER